MEEVTTRRSFCARREILWIVQRVQDCELKAQERENKLTISDRPKTRCYILRYGSIDLVSKLETGVSCMQDNLVEDTPELNNKHICDR